MTEPASAARNRRLSRRRPPKGRVKITCRRGALDLGPNLALSLLDVSVTGARLIVKQTLEPGREVSIGLEGQSSIRPIPRVAVVTWCVPAADGTFCAGVHFQKRLSYRDFLELSREPETCA